MLLTTVFSVCLGCLFLFCFIPVFTTFRLISLFSLFVSFVLFSLFILMPTVKALCIGIGEKRERRRYITFDVSSSLVDFIRIHSFFGLLEAFKDSITASLIILTYSSPLV
jgi:hypothetical protein